MENRMKKYIVLVSFGLFAIAATADCPSWPTVNRFTFSADGTEVTDQRTGLVWARCSVGQTWSASTCVGSSSTFSHEGALQHAALQTGWRLPTLRELSSLADKGCDNPAIDSTAFPNTPIAWFWTSSAYAGVSHYAWEVSFEDGAVRGASRNVSYHARLVRAGH
jgi:Protein of unknown function (DUF1566)